MVIAIKPCARSIKVRGFTFRTRLSSRWNRSKSLLCILFAIIARIFAGVSYTSVRLCLIRLAARSRYNKARAVCGQHLVASRECRANINYPNRRQSGCELCH
ncbi:hypothetical protein PUN28_004846 [Cardiocondyla obscurior]|uniref:Uncharacterized protein n=1 Tax=Cardiocondyla obscurior TaxID=286306 RepID=A0AAW2GFV6_9HYME